MGLFLHRSEVSALRLPKTDVVGESHQNLCGGSLPVKPCLHFTSGCSHNLIMLKEEVEVVNERLSASNWWRVYTPR